MKINLHEIKYNYSVFVIGTGATGSNLLPFLSQLIANIEDRDHKITIIDGDIFETKNLKNQKCTYYDIGKSKAEILCERYSLVYPDLNIAYINEYIKTEEDMIKTICKRLDHNDIPVIVSCVDNNATRLIFNKVFNSEYLSDLIYIDSGNGTENRNGQIVVGYKTFSKNSTNGNRKICKDIYKVLTPVYDVFKKQIDNDSNDDIDTATSCARVSSEKPQNIATNVMAASTLFCILNELISFDNINTHIAYFDAENAYIDMNEVKYKDYSEAFTTERLMASYSL